METDYSAEIIVMGSLADGVGEEAIQGICHDVDRETSTMINQYNLRARNTPLDVDIACVAICSNRVIATITQ